MSEIMKGMAKAVNMSPNNKPEAEMDNVTTKRLESVDVFLFS
jgi:hypothetical protein